MNSDKFDIDQLRILDDLNTQVDQEIKKAFAAGMRSAKVPPPEVISQPDVEDDA